MKHFRSLLFSLVLLLVSLAGAAEWSEIANSQHSLRSLGKEFYVDVPVAPIQGARLILFNADAAKRLGLEVPADPAVLEKVILDNFALFVNPENPTKHMMATYYQDSGRKGPGEANGDGRAVWTGESKLGNGSVDFVLKGIGVTPLAWTNHPESGHKDGLQAVGEAVHSFVHSEANFKNGLDSTVDLAVIEIPLQKENKYTGKMENATITLRAGDQFRVAHLAYHSDNISNQKKFFNYIMDREFRVKDPVEYFRQFTLNLSEEAARMYDLHAVHGSPTLGNRSLRGSTIDMGTFRYLDANHGEYSYLFNRMFHRKQKEQMRSYIRNNLDFLLSTGVIAREQYPTISAMGDRLFDDTYKETLTKLWLGRLGLNEMQMAKIGPEIRSRFYLDVFRLYEESANTKTTLAGQEIKPAAIDVRQIFKNILAHLSEGGDLNKLTPVKRPWMNSDRSYLYRDFKDTAAYIIRSLDLSKDEWRELYLRNQKANASVREVPTDDLFFQKEKVITEMIEKKKSYVEISKVAMDSVNDLVDDLLERTAQPEGYRMMSGLKKSTAVAVRCEKVFF
ncbi:protein adenylyltransferase SelO family protein [Bdellovibrio sp. HCB288]|uniref:protein adenylyltransferase SelO family protein n=1 Tax=Bdellovibrio sp. HCB288 TaxID=3394355 RepID=UPI0039B556E1